KILIVEKIIEEKKDEISEKVGTEEPPTSIPSEPSPSDQEVIAQPIEEEVKQESKVEEAREIVEEKIVSPSTAEQRKHDIDIDQIPAEDLELIEGIELASQYELEHEPIKESLEFEKESLQKLANLLQALDPGNDMVLSPLTRKLLSLGVEETEKTERKVTQPLSEPVVEVTEVTKETEKPVFSQSVDKLSDILSSPEAVQDSARFIDAIRDTISKVSRKTEEDTTTTPLTRIIEAETGQVEEAPVRIQDIENIIAHLEEKREKAIERVKKLEQIIISEKVDEAEWQDLMINAQQHLLRIEDTLDGYKRVMKKLKTKISN
ncbi:MAG: hypothetical protein ACTSPI_08990, partial [Candidatus Heimdallarchaeaceae archaeon]